MGGDENGKVGGDENGKVGGDENGKVGVNEVLGGGEWEEQSQLGRG